MTLTKSDVCDLLDLADLLRRPAWHADAACVDHNSALWFPPLASRVSTTVHF